MRNEDRARRPSEATIWVQSGGRVEGSHEAEAGVDNEPARMGSAQRCCKVAIGDAKTSQVGQGAAQRINTDSEGRRGQSKLGEDAVSIATRWRWASQSR